MREFLCASAGEEHRDYLVSREGCCRSKTFGGLGIGNVM